MARRVPARTWLALALGLGVVISAILGVLVVTSSSLDVAFVGRQQAFAEMDRVRATFGGQAPCLDRQPASSPSARALTPPRTVHMLAWEREDDRLVRVATPYWALRIGAFKLNAARLIVPPLEHVLPLDLERCGPGLLVDRRTADGGRVVAWTD